MNNNPVLETLKEVAHVLGSFAGDTEGQLLASAMPGYFAAGDLEAAAGRVAGLFLCVKETELDGQSAVLQFGEHSLFVSRFESGHLCVLAEAAVNVASLRMATKLVARRLPASLERRDPLSEAGSVGAVSDTAKGSLREPFHEDTLVSARLSSRPPPLPSADGEPSRRTIVYRGRRFEV